jgi:hypothetical protein
LTNARKRSPTPTTAPAAMVVANRGAHAVSCGPGGDASGIRLSESGSSIANRWKANGGAPSRLMTHATAFFDFVLLLVICWCFSDRPHDHAVRHLGDPATKPYASSCLPSQFHHRPCLPKPAKEPPAGPGWIFMRLSTTASASWPAAMATYARNG